METEVNTKKTGKAALAGSSGPAEEKRALTIAEEIDALTDPSFMTSLARGLAVIRAFSDQRRSLTIAQISHRTGIPRAAVRRCLFTLKQLGYVDSEANNFSLKPKILTLGYSYLSSTPLMVSAQPTLNAISRALGESCSLAMLDEGEVLYVSGGGVALGCLARHVGGAQYRQPPARLLHLARQNPAGPSGRGSAGFLLFAN
jgi:IclR family pca regulon transcriptional regulator